jgi:hypothetical protein
MLTKEITIGMQARVLVGNRLAVVTVISVSKYSRGREAYRCLTADTGRMITATAKRLRPLPGTPEAAAERARKLAAQRRRESQHRDAKPAAIQPWYRFDASTDGGVSWFTQEVCGKPKTV